MPSLIALGLGWASVCTEGREGREEELFLFYMCSQSQAPRLKGQPRGQLSQPMLERQGLGQRLEQGVGGGRRQRG